MASGAHPVELKNYALPTPGTESALDTLLTVIRKRRTGLVIQGDYRGGKTWFCKLVKRLFQEMFQDGSLTVFWFLCERHKRSPTERRHLDWMVGSVDYKIGARDPYSRKAQLVDYLCQEGRKSKRRQVVLIFDEAQELWLDQLRWLLDVYDAIVDADLAPTFVFIGQPELKGRRTSLLQAKYEQMVDRFFALEDILRGPASADETEEWLKSFGELSRGIAPDGLPFTEHFFPAAYRAGWRLEVIGKALYRCFAEAFEEAGLPMPETIRTKYFFNTVEELFVTFGDPRVLQPDMSDDVLKQAIKNSGYIDAVSRNELFNRPGPDEM